MSPKVKLVLDFIIVNINSRLKNHMYCAKSGNEFGLALVTICYDGLYLLVVVMNIIILSKFLSVFFNQIVGRLSFHHKKN